MSKTNFSQVSFGKINLSRIFLILLSSFFTYVQPDIPPHAPQNKLLTPISSVNVHTPKHYRCFSLTPNLYNHWYVTWLPTQLPKTYNPPPSPSECHRINYLRLTSSLKGHWSPASGLAVIPPTTASRAIEHSDLLQCIGSD